MVEKTRQHEEAVGTLTAPPNLVWAGAFLSSREDVRINQLWWMAVACRGETAF